MSQLDRIERAKERREIWRMVIIIMSLGALLELGGDLVHLLFNVIFGWMV